MRGDESNGGWRARALLGAALLAAGAVGTAEAATYRIDIARTSADEEAPTFSGGGTITIDGPLLEPSDIDALSLSITTLGSLGDDDVTYRFDYTEQDVTNVVGFADGSVPSDLMGLIIGLGSKSSQGGEVTIGGFGDGLSLDFERTAQGFCFDSVGSAQCVRGGGTSTGIEANLSAAIIPLPASLPLALSALGGLAAWGSRRRRSRAA